MIKLRTAVLPPAVVIVLVTVYATADVPPEINTVAVVVAFDWLEIVIPVVTANEDVAMVSADKYVAQFTT